MNKFLCLIVLGILLAGFSCKTDEDPVVENPELDALKRLPEEYQVPTVIKTVVRGGKEFTVAYFRKEFFDTDFKGNYIFLMYKNYFNWEDKDNVWYTPNPSSYQSWFKISESDSKTMVFALLEYQQSIYLKNITFEDLNADRFKCFYSKRIETEEHDGYFSFDVYIPCIIAEGKSSIKTMALVNPDLGHDPSYRPPSGNKYNNYFPYNYDFTK